MTQSLLTTYRSKSVQESNSEDDDDDDDETSISIDLSNESYELEKQDFIQKLAKATKE